MDSVAIEKNLALSRLIRRPSNPAIHPLHCTDKGRQPEQFAPVSFGATQHLGFGDLRWYPENSHLVQIVVTGMPLAVTVIGDFAKSLYLLLLDSRLRAALFWTQGP